MNELDLTKDGHAQRYLDPARYIIQVWTSGSDVSIAQLYRQNYRLIISNFDVWYLDRGFGAWMGPSDQDMAHSALYVQWQQIYENSPRRIIEHFDLKYNQPQILGGEAALWSEQVNNPFKKSNFELKKTNN